LTYGLESVQDCDDKQPPAENSYEKEQMERPDEIVETQTQNDSCDLSSTVEGRRVIDVAFMASQMTCIACSNQLHLMDIVKETRYGLASLSSNVASMIFIIGILFIDATMLGPHNSISFLRCQITFC